MSDFPDPEEEYELMYADELEMLNEDEENNAANIIKKKSLPAKRSLDFSSPTAFKPIPSKVSSQPSETNSTPDISLTPNLQPLETIEDIPPPSSKRTAEELFGDIDDIDFNEQLPSKKQKTEEEHDLDLIDKILEGRRLKQILLEPTGRGVGCRSNYNVKENLSLDIPRWAFLPLTNSDGERVYVKLESEESWESSLDINTDQVSLHSTYASTWDEARKILETKQERQLGLIDDPTQPLPDINTDINGNVLWVEKYKPKSYVDLLSEEPVNRALLHWLHLWDKIVFNKEVKTLEPQQRTTFSARAGQFQLTSKWRGKKEADVEMDEDGRPHHKLALLCGPPGVGKTTLAHLLAKIAGYRPVEINASDERSTDAFRTALQSATLMRSVLDAEKRPNCLILDEIDGAPLPTVELLVRWCTATVPEGKKKAKTQPLKRPVIAICNDLYATSLRPLRAIALIVHVGGVSVPRLVSRLQHVCSRERLALAPHVAAALAARARGDVRAAILLLSFVKARANEQLSIEDVENAAIGTKDCHKSLLQALQSIFTTNDRDPGAALKTIQAAGEYDRLADGIFENYLTSRSDGRLLVTSAVCEWLVLHDKLSSWVLRHQNYSVFPALPLVLARCASLLASRTPIRVKFPFQAQEMYRKKVELESVVQAVLTGSAPAVCNNRSALLLDVLPLLPYLLAPSLRTANVQLCSETERKALRTTAGAMCDYGLQYVQQRTHDGLYSFVLEPPIYKVAFYGTEEKVRPPPAIRQAISREQQLEVIRRNEEMASRVPNKGKSNDTPKAKVDKKPVSTSKDKEVPLPNHLQRLQPKAVVRSAPQVHKDFFGRIVPLSQVQRNDPVADVISSSSVFYQYQEGFNNAVRRNVRVRDLL
ncbi:unnamed protein product [Chrysodeixis includens]|uniref:AAA+ ATPase domain-containing protein n=1 Tax=Chrysodeixis includens TaxID=689277 RepID=A0A9P0FVH2_CHRIL|nr:unnamed protein product [Chrysodeixis includens]